MTVEIPLLSDDVRAMIDNMIFVACYGHKKMFEARVPQETIVAFRNCAFWCARKQERSFYYLWKEYLKKAGGSKESAEVTKERSDLFRGMMGDDDDDDGVAAGGAAADGSAAIPEPEASQAGEDEA